jgi:hypothetical protein
MSVIALIYHRHTLLDIVSVCMGHAVALLVETLCFKPEGHRFDSGCDDWVLNSPNPSSRTMARGSTQPLTEMSTRNLPEV